MKKIILPAITILALSACNMKKENAESRSKWPTRTDTIIYSSASDPHKSDTMLLKVGVDTTAEGTVDTILVPSPDPPYDPMVTVRKRTPQRNGTKICIPN